MREFLHAVSFVFMTFFELRLNSVRVCIQLFIPNLRLLFVRITLAISLIASPQAIYSQLNPELGLPLIKSFSMEEYEAHGQNWAITQDKNGVMYFGNTMGVLEYDGNSWRLHPFTSIVRSIEADDAGCIFIGAQGDFGYLKPDSTGTNQYFSLIGRLSETDREFTNVWKTYATTDGVYFSTVSHLFRWKNDSIRIWYPGDHPFGWSFMIRDTLYIQKRGVGIYKMVSDSLQLLPGTEQVAQVTIFFIVPFKESKILIGTRARGLEVYGNGEITTFNTEISGYLKENGIYTAKVLRDSTIAIGTQGGLIIISNQGKFIKVVTDAEGMLDKSILSLFSDQQDHLWAGLQNGISRLDWPSPVTNYGPESNIEGHIEVVMRHLDTLFVGGRSGLYYLHPPQIENGSIANSHFKLIKDLEGLNCSALISFDERLIVGTNNGIYEITNGKITNIGYEQTHINCLYRSIQNPSRLFAGGPGILVSLELSNGRWIDEGRINGIASEIRPILEQSDGKLWLGTRYGGPLCVDFSDGLKKNPVIDHFDDSFGIPDGDVYVFTLHDRIVFGTDSGLYRFDEDKKYFYPDTTLGELFAGKPNGKEVFRIAADDTGNVWISTAPHFGLQRIQQDGTFSWETAPYMKMNPSVYSIFPEQNDVTWFGGDGGIYRYDRKTYKNYQKDYFVLIRRVLVNNDSLIYNGNRSYDIISNALTSAIPNLDFRHNELRFEYSATDFADESSVQYQYLLEGYDKKWSTWTTDNRKEYTNLPGGDYTFRVRARNIYDQFSQEGNYEFIISPPWWMTWWAYVCYTILVTGVMSWLARWYAHFRTLEQRKKLAKEQEINRRLKQVDKLKDQFLANTSHELRTPLTGIIGISESLIDGVAGRLTDRARSNLSLIISSARRLSSLVNSILDYSKLKTHELILSLKAIDLRTITDVVIQISQPMIKGKSIILKNAINEFIPLVDADEERLYQIMLNLIGNAIKFTNTGEIIISAVEIQHMVQVCIQDTGIGIPKDKIEDIFKSFEQVDASITRDYGGTGLGLTITKQLVELHGGNIWIESIVEKGTSVYFTLPVTKQPASSTKQESFLSKVKIYNNLTEKIETKLDLTQNDSRFSIMIVDDEPINQQVLSNHLSKEHFKILQAMNGNDALEIIGKEKLDMVLLDIMMPKMSGYEVCREIRKKYLPSELPVIMITAKDQVQDLVEGLASGANDYLAKPFSKDELLARLKTHLNLYHINSAYLRFIPKEFLKALGHDSIIDVSLGDQVQGEMTILFSDIRSFTSVTEKLSAQESFEFLNEILKYITPAITSGGGFIDKYIGDAVMALFPGNPEDAILAAIQVQKKLGEYNEEREAAGKEKVKIGIGIHTGPLMLGTIGVENRMDGTVISDAVNLASRLEELNKLYGTSMIISEESLKTIENLNKYSYRFLSYVRVKGKKIAVKIYEFFDGDEHEEKTMKLKTLQTFNEGIKEYYDQKFTKASVKFQQVLDINSEDQTARLFLEKSAQFMVQGVPDNWDGVDIVEKVF